MLYDNLKQARAASFTSVSPNSGPTGVWTNVTLIGSGFADKTRVVQISNSTDPHLCFALDRKRKMLEV